MAKTRTYLPEFVKVTEPRPLTRDHGARYELPSAAQDQSGLWVSGAGYSVRNAGKTEGRTLGTYAAVMVTSGSAAASRKESVAGFGASSAASAAIRSA